MKHSRSYRLTRTMYFATGALMLNLLLLIPAQGEFERGNVALVWVALLGCVLWTGAAVASAVYAATFIVKVETRVREV